MSNKPIHKVKRGNVQILVWENRVTIKKKKLFGWHENNIPMRKIVNVTTNKMTQKICIETEKDKFEYRLGGLTTVQKLAEVILDNL